MCIQSQKRDSKVYHKTEPFLAELGLAFPGNDWLNLNCLFVPEFSLSLTIWSEKLDSKAYHQIEPFFAEFGLVSLAMTDWIWIVCLFLNSHWEWVAFCVSLRSQKHDSNWVPGSNPTIARPITNGVFVLQSCKIAFTDNDNPSLKWTKKRLDYLGGCILIWLSKRFCTLTISSVEKIKTTLETEVAAAQISWC